MTIDIFKGQDFSRKTFHVEAVTITPANMQQLAEIVGGEVKHDGEKEQHFSRDYISVPVRNPMHKRQTEGYIGDVIVKQGHTYKVYPEGKFRQMFERKAGSSPVQSSKPHQGKKPNPGNMPKKRTPDLIKENGVVRRLSETPAGTPDPEPKPISHAEATQAAVGSDGPQVITNEKSIDATLHSKGAGSIELVKIRDNMVDAIQDGNTEKMEELVAESIEVMDEQKAAESKETVVKPITLDELNSQPGDPRTAAEITMDDNGQTPGMKFRGEG